MATTITCPDCQRVFVNAAGLALHRNGSKCLKSSLAKSDNTQLFNKFVEAFEALRLERKQAYEKVAEIDKRLADLKARVVFYITEEDRAEDEERIKA